MEALKQQPRHLILALESSLTVPYLHPNLPPSQTLGFLPGNASPVRSNFSAPGASPFLLGWWPQSHLPLLTTTTTTTRPAKVTATHAGAATPSSTKVFTVLSTRYTLNVFKFS